MQNKLIVFLQTTISGILSSEENLKGIVVLELQIALFLTVFDKISTLISARTSEIIMRKVTLKVFVQCEACLSHLWPYSGCRHEGHAPQGCLE